MGLVLTVGILTTLLCSLVVLPSLLAWLQSRAAQRAASI
jgi:predicted RND superfamily exporter protein